MGLDQFVRESDRHDERCYPDHEHQQAIEDIIDDNRHKFPGGVEVDFIEVSPKMTRSHGMFYPRTEKGYIRVSEDMMERFDWEYIERVILHEVVHAWFYQNGFGQHTDGSKIFEWACGKVGADVTGIDPKTEEYEIIKAFSRT